MTSTSNNEQISELANDSEADFYKILAENSSDGLAVFTNRGKLIYASPSYLKMMKSTFEELSQRSTQELKSDVHPDDISATLETIMTAIKLNQENVIYQYRILIDGEYRWREDHNKFVYDAEGNIVRSYIVARDITDLKNAKIQAIKHYNLLESIANSVPVMIWIDDENKDNLYFNDYWLEFRGRTLQEELFDGWTDGMHPDDFQKCSDIYGKAFENRTPYTMEFRLKHHTGEYRWVLDSGRPRYDLDGNFIGYIGSCMDIESQKRLQYDLQASKDFLSNITNQVNGVIHKYSIDSEGNHKWLYLNPKVEEIYEVTAEEAYATPNLLSSLMSKEDVDKIYSLLNESMIDLVPFEFEYRIRTKSGQIKWLLSEASPERKPDGSTIWYGYTSDITDKKNNHLQYESAGRLARVGGWEVDLINNQIIWSDVTRDIHGVPRDYRPDLDTAIKFYKEGYSRDTIAKCVQNLINKAIKYDVELQIVTPKGEEKWIRTIGDAEFIDGECVRIFGAFQDIDAQKRLQNELERLFYVITHINDMVIIASLDHLIEWVNPAFTKITGYSLEEVKGLKPGSFLQGLDTDSYTVNKISNSLKANKPIRETILNYTKQGVAYWVDLNIEPIFDYAGNLEYFVSIQRDVTERMKYEQEILNVNINLEKKVIERTIELEKSNKALIELNKMKDKFIGIASHDLKNPLTAIIGQTELLATKLDKYGAELKPILTANINNILATANRMNDIINEFLDINKIHEGSYSVNKKHYTVGEVCHHVVDNMMTMANKKNIEIIKDIDTKKVIYIYRLSMMQIAENLISNAIKYSYPNSKVIINCVADEKQFIFIVQDFGQGMNEDDLTKIYKPYSKLSSQPTAGENSVGLGLSIVKHLVEINGGTIICETFKGVGTKFVVTFSQID